MGRTPIAVFVACIACIASCDGCDPRCTEAPGTEGCGCEFDQDCATKLDAVLLCVDHRCARGDPDDVVGETPCDGDDGCPTGQACGRDGTCAAAPRCQRLSPAVEWRFAIATGGSGAAVVAPNGDCGSSIAMDLVAGVVDITSIDLDGLAVVGVSSACSAASYSAAFRLLRLDCGALVAVAPSDVATCVGTACGAPGCTVVFSEGGDIGVCGP